MTTRPERHRSLVVVSAGLSTPSSTRLLADRLAASASAALTEAGDTVTIETVELRELAHDLTDQLLTGVPSERLEQVQTSLAAADGVVAVSPIFTASYSGLFKTFLDLLEPGLLAGKPVLLGATAGSARHSLALDQAMRPLFAYLRAVPTPTGVVAATSDFAGRGEAEDDLSERVARAGAELAAFVRAADGRTVDEPRPTGGTAALTPFEQLLAQARR
ncbi:CE1759 family FMN reductase [Desertihabitans aurantiacus]|uniref:CE1759 family FMN reductase n=1 Tax=Desertihabitans aurantiacus TaxID=2282477 RepID=UPI000DF7E2CA|nr:CE1759 family FMN reductase [Desertihabitans aurantiacus]